MTIGSKSEETPDASVTDGGDVVITGPGAAGAALAHTDGSLSLLNVNQLRKNGVGDGAERNACVCCLQF